MAVNSMRLLVAAWWRPGAPGPASCEVEVIRLMGRGLTTNEIANELVISEVTVKRHIGRIFTNLDLRDRAAAIIYAFDHGMAVPGPTA